VEREEPPPALPRWFDFISLCLVERIDDFGATVLVSVRGVDEGDDASVIGVGALSPLTMFVAAVDGATEVTEVEPVILEGAVVGERFTGALFVGRVTDDDTFGFVPLARFADGARDVPMRAPPRDAMKSSTQSLSRMREIDGNKASKQCA
jgi:hypothetical protein